MKFKISQDETSLKLKALIYTLLLASFLGLSGCTNTAETEAFLNAEDQYVEETATHKDEYKLAQLASVAINSGDTCEFQWIGSNDQCKNIKALYKEHLIKAANKGNLEALNYRIKNHPYAYWGLDHKQINAAFKLESATYQYYTGYRYLKGQPIQNFRLSIEHLLNALGGNLNQEVAFALGEAFEQVKDPGNAAAWFTVSGSISNANTQGLTSPYEIEESQALALQTKRLIDSGKLKDVKKLWMDIYDNTVSDLTRQEKS